MKPITFVIFGGTGDLAKRKLAPAFKALEEEGLIPQNSLLVGVGRSEYNSDTYRDALLEMMPECKDGMCLPNINIKYVQTDSSKEGAFKELKDKLAEWESKDTAQRVFYLATTYKIFPDILKNLKEAHLHKEDGKDSKIVFEKPFGHGLDSAKELETEIHNVFDEKDVFRIDHYLGKETVRNLTMLKYSNPIIQDLLNNRHVEKVEVFADEDMGVGNRLGYYDGAGAVKDMIQSHLLQVAALILMNPPESIFSSDVHDKKVEVLRDLHIAETGHTLGQYEGYKEELKEADLPESETETFASLSLYSNSPEWQGVPIYLRTGKALDRKKGKIIVYFKQKELKDVKGLSQNTLIIDIHPDEDIKLYFNTRKRDTTDEVEVVPLDFCGDCHFGPNTSDGYKILLHEMLQGHKTLFTRDDELLESWRIIEEFVAIKSSLKVQNYKKGSSHKDII